MSDFCAADSPRRFFAIIFLSLRGGVAAAKLARDPWGSEQAERSECRAVWGTADAGEKSR